MGWFRKKSQEERLEKVEKKVEDIDQQLSVERKEREKIDRRLNVIRSEVAVIRRGR